jgi:hypothetical protein
LAHDDTALFGTAVDTSLRAARLPFSIDGWRGEIGPMPRHAPITNPTPGEPR